MANRGDGEILSRVDDMLRAMTDEVPAFAGLLAGHNLADSGIDSAAFLHLLLALETHFGLVLDPEELNKSNFDDKRVLASFIARRTRSSGAGQ